MEEEKADLQRRVFFEVHSGNPREGPGCFASTQRAFLTMRDLPPSPRILDVGCGPGRQTLDLASLTEGTIHAVDNHPPFIQALQAAAARLPLRARITAEVADMVSLPFPPGSFDVVWSEGAIYIIGLEAGLRLWKPLLKSGGYLALTHVTWLREDPPDEIREFWREAYPAIDTLAQNEAVFQRAGYELLETFVLPERAWIDEYYRPLERRVKDLRATYAGNPVALEVLDMEDREFALYKRYSADYGYAFFIARRS